MHTAKRSREMGGGGGGGGYIDQRLPFGPLPNGINPADFHILSVPAADQAAAAIPGPPGVHEVQGQAQALASQAVSALAVA